MELWIPVTIAAALFQTLRFMLQKQLSMGTLSAGGATFARFLYSAPLVVAGLGLFLAVSGTELPRLGPAFWVYAWIGGLAQILATVCVVLLFALRNFAVGITLKKAEVVQTALVGVIILGEAVSALGLGAILIGLIGVLLLSDASRLGGQGRARFANKAAGLGLLSGMLFAVSGVCYRGATLEVASDVALMRAGVTLAAVTASQMLAMTAWLAWREPGEIGRVWAARRSGLLIGLTSMAGSLSWFVAFTLQTVAYVFALGQVELIFSLMASVLVFRERVSARELAGIGFLTASILVLVGVT